MANTVIDTVEQVGCRAVSLELCIAISSNLFDLHIPRLWPFWLAAFPSPLVVQIGFGLHWLSATIQFPSDGAGRGVRHAIPRASELSMHCIMHENKVK